MQFIDSFLSLRPENNSPPEGTRWQEFYEVEKSQIDTVIISVFAPSLRPLR